MTITYLLKGLVIGFAIVAPVGPIGVLCIRRSLVQGRLYGLFSGLGAAAADAVYGFIAAFGLTVITSFLLDYKLWLQLIGGLFLCYLGMQTLLSKPAEYQGDVQEGSLLASFFSTLFLTITNPVTILAFISIFAGLGLSNEHGNSAYAVQLVAGVFAGSASWWLLLSVGVGFFRKKISLTSMIWVNRISGIVILTFGIVALIQQWTS
ncbi:Threonine/homoserine/homoserine lactone efflux protein [Evansella caseinilytica]|uniref:Threonine/homoserine/homoserine lactone efflux protein n=1 Tax=Evansella caseinilytica TaxID=1503961 RepID=A0A1H3SHK8_9BACI|nr:LysE family transporter [Evansella caseinilytica]SDZ37452.1 Threonine/homoserine/homoserine lactone efflux protein [Evansella caseinilytica]